MQTELVQTGAFIAVPVYNGNNACIGTVALTKEVYTDGAGFIEFTRSYPRGTGQVNWKRKIPVIVLRSEQCGSYVLAKKQLIAKLKRAKLLDPL